MFFQANLLSLCCFTSNLDTSKNLFISHTVDSFLDRHGLLAQSNSPSRGYHHRGAEPTNPIAFGMVSMAPELGVPVMAKRMLSTVRTMVEAYKAQLRFGAIFSELRAG